VHAPGPRECNSRFSARPGAPRFLFATPQSVRETVEPLLNGWRAVRSDDRRGRRGAIGGAGYDGGHHDAKNSDLNNCTARLLGRCLRSEFPAQAASVSRRGDELGARRGAALRLRADGRREMVRHPDYIGARRLCDAAGAGRIEETQNADRVHRSPADKRVRAIPGDKGVGDRLLTQPAAVIRVRRRSAGTPASSRSPGRDMNG